MNDEEPVTKVKRKRGRPSAAAKSHQQSSQNYEDKHYEKLMKQMKFLVNCVLKYKDTDGRVLSEPFQQLPTKRELPDYYEIIKRPIDLKKIQQKIKDHKYSSLDMLANDIDLMCKNTQEYNMEGSLIYEDSIVLHSVFKSARARLEAENESDNESGNEQIEDEDEDDPDGSMIKPSKNKRARVEKMAPTKGERKMVETKKHKKRASLVDDEDDDEDSENNNNNNNNQDEDEELDVDEDASNASLHKKRSKKHENKKKEVKFGSDEQGLGI